MRSAGRSTPASGASSGWTASGGRVVVGLTRFALAEEESYEPLRVDPAIEAAQSARLGRLRAERDAGEGEQGLAALPAAAARSENVLPPMKRALAARATVGEVCDALREVWGV